MHFYPEGAIQTREAIPSNVYKVYALGASSFIKTMLEVRDFEYTKEDNITSFKYITSEGYDTSGCLDDCNIGKHHNKHYLFTKRADAEAYLEWAKRNTKTPEPIDWEY